jgi:hypothetical protein
LGGSDGRLGKMSNEEIHNLYSSPDNIMVVKSRRARWAGPAERIGITRNT